MTTVSAPRPIGKAGFELPRKSSAQKATARRILADENLDAQDARLDRLFDLVLNARATEGGRAELKAFINEMTRRLTEEGDSDAALRAWSMACHALFASSRFQILE